MYALLSLDWPREGSMVTRQEIARILQHDDAPVGYRIEENDHGGITVEYSSIDEIPSGRKPIRWGAITPSEEISRCQEILELRGYSTGLVRAPGHHILVVRGRR